MLVGSFGTILFRTSSFDITTFKNLQRKRQYHFTRHDVVNGKSCLHFAGEALESITFDFVFDRALNPLLKDCGKYRDMLVEMAGTGNAFPLVIGTAFLGNFVVENIEEKDKEILGNIITRMDLSVSLTEYH